MISPVVPDVARNSIVSWSTVPVTDRLSPVLLFCVTVICSRPVTLPRPMTLTSSPVAVPLPTMLNRSTPSRLTVPPTTPVTAPLDVVTPITSSPAVAFSTTRSPSPTASPPRTRMPPAKFADDSIVTESLPPRVLITRRSKPETSVSLLKPNRFVTRATPSDVTLTVSSALVPGNTPTVPVTCVVSMSA